MLTPHFQVEPTKGALVVNLGNLMQRWTNEKFKSNVHRVINKSGKERYSIPVFVSGNVSSILSHRDCAFHGSSIVTCFGILILLLEANIYDTSPTTW